MTLRQKPASVCLQQRNEPADADEGLVLLAFLWRELAFGAFVRQGLDACLQLGVRAEAQRGFGTWPIERGVGFYPDRSRRGPAASDLRAHPAFGLHQRLTKPVQLGLNLGGIQHGAFHFLAHQLRVPLA
jgi:hypothetical protein